MYIESFVNNGKPYLRIVQSVRMDVRFLVKLSLFKESDTTRSRKASAIISPFSNRTIILTKLYDYDMMNVQ